MIYGRVDQIRSKTPLTDEERMLINEAVNAGRVVKVAMGVSGYRKDEIVYDEQTGRLVYKNPDAVSWKEQNNATWRNMNMAKARAARMAAAGPTREVQIAELINKGHTVEAAAVLLGVELVSAIQYARKAASSGLIPPLPKKERQTKALDEFVAFRKLHHDKLLKDVAELMGKNYETIKSLNQAAVRKGLL